MEQLQVSIRNRVAHFLQLTTEQITILDAMFSIKVPNAEYSAAFKSGSWDGVHKFFDRITRTLSIGLLSYIEQSGKYKVSVLQSDKPLTQYTIEGFAPKDEKGDVLDLRSYQLESVNSLLQNNGGLVSVATNGGKTLAISAIAHAYVSKGINVLILEGRTNLADQVSKSVSAHTHTAVTVYGSKTKTFGQITVAMVPSLVTVVASLVHKHKIGCIIVDECHHATSPTYQKILNSYIKADRYGLSGTIPPASTYKGFIIRELMGDVLVTVRNSELVELGVSARPDITMIEYSQDEDFSGRLAKYKEVARAEAYTPKYNTFTRTTEMAFSVSKYTAKVKTFVMQVAITESQVFAAIIQSLVAEHAGKSIAILTDWKAFADTLATSLGAVSFHSDTPNRTEVLESFATGTTPVLVATQILDEGISIDRIQVLILANAGYSSRQFLQRLGRGLRKKSDGSDLFVYDFIRYGHDYLINPSKERYKLWVSEGFNVKFKEW